MADHLQSIDLSTQPELVPTSNFTDHLNHHTVPSMVEYHGGFLSCGGYEEVQDRPESNECWHFQVDRAENPLLYPPMMTARRNAMMTKVMGRPWILGGGQNEPGIYYMCLFLCHSNCT